MTERRRVTAADIDRLARELSLDVAPAADLWPSIARVIRAQGRDVESAVRSLEAEIEPSKDLWPGIRAEISGHGAGGAGPARRARLQWLAAAASVASVALIAALLGYVVGRPISLDQGGGTGDGDAWWIALIEDAPRADDPSTREMLGILEAVRTEFVSVRNERIEIESALGRDPASPVLTALWRHAYEQELALTNRAQLIATSFERLRT